MTKKFEKVRQNRDKMNALKLENHCFSLGKTHFSRNSVFPRMYPKINKKTSKIQQKTPPKRSKNDAKTTCKNVMNFDDQKCEN